MTIYKLPRAIKRAAIIYPGKPLKAWYAEQTDKPDILCNASLYKGVNKPIGTIIRNRTLVNNAGSGVGVGVKDGALGFGTPWSGWDDYLTAYHACVQKGETVVPPWKDEYVFDTALHRIGVGQLKNGDPVLVTDNSVTIKKLSDRAVQNGVELLCNLDGGGSRALLWLGKWIYTSGRTPYNAIAIWLEPTAPRKTLKRTAAVTVTPCGADGIPQSGRRIDPGDKCTLQYGSVPIPVTYPVAGGSRSAYLPSMTGMAAIYNQHDYAAVPYPALGYEGATVKSGGCGPTAAAIAVETLCAWIHFDPAQAAAFAIKTGARVSGGTDMGVLAKRLGEKFGLTVGATSVLAELRAHLSRGGVAIANVAGRGMFSTGGHYVVVLGLSGGKLAIVDPGYYYGKYGAKYPARQKAVTVAGKGTNVILRAAPETLDADCVGRAPRYYLLSR